MFSCSFGVCICKGITFGEKRDVEQNGPKRGALLDMYGGGSNPCL